MQSLQAICTWKVSKRTSVIVERQSSTAELNELAVTFSHAKTVLDNYSVRSIKVVLTVQHKFQTLWIITISDKH